MLWCSTILGSHSPGSTLLCASGTISGPGRVTPLAGLPARAPPPPWSPSELACSSPYLSNWGRPSGTLTPLCPLARATRVLSMGSRAPSTNIYWLPEPLRPYLADPLPVAERSTKFCTNRSHAQPIDSTRAPIRTPCYTRTTDSNLHP